MRKHPRIFWTIVCVPLLLIITSGTPLAAEETGGVGLQVMQLYDYATNDANKRGSIVVLDVSKGSPAEQNGIKKGDIILQVNETVTRKHDFDDIVNNLLRGSSNTDVKLVIWRPCAHEKLEVTLKRMQTAY
jgi:C-terminal processing protease CtpA/Prc